MQINTIISTDSDISPNGETKIFRPKKYNNELRRKRLENTIRLFDTIIRDKPTRHIQRCPICGIEFIVGERQVIVNNGLYYGYANEGRRTSFTTLKTGWKSFAPAKDVIIYMKKYYLHPECYACQQNKMFLRGNLHGIINHSLCEQCEHKFKCYTGEYSTQKINGIVPE